MYQNTYSYSKGWSSTQIIIATKYYLKSVACLRLPSNTLEITLAYTCTLELNNTTLFKDNS